jgi:hypothetical protein
MTEACPNVRYITVCWKNKLFVKGYEKQFLEDFFTDRRGLLPGKNYANELQRRGQGEIPPSPERRYSEEVCPHTLFVIFVGFEDIRRKFFLWPLLRCRRM